jgi:hypothetical protein
MALDPFGGFTGLAIPVRNDRVLVARPGGRARVRPLRHHWDRAVELWRGAGTMSAITVSDIYRNRVRAGRLTPYGATRWRQFQMAPDAPGVWTLEGGVGRDGRLWLAAMIRRGGHDELWVARPGQKSRRLRRFRSRAFLHAVVVGPHERGRAILTGGGGLRAVRL